MYTKYLKTTCSKTNFLRFNFNAIVTCFYFNNFGEYSPRIMLESVDIASNGTIGIEKDRLIIQVKEALSDLTQEELEQIIGNFEENSYSVDPTYISIVPDFIIQCTGKYSINKVLIYEGDVVKDTLTNKSYVVIWDEEKCSFFLQDICNKEGTYPLCNLLSLNIIGNIFLDMGNVK